MLSVALEYRKAIEDMTATKGLRKFELRKNEWVILEDLHFVLKVHFSYYLYD